MLKVCLYRLADEALLTGRSYQQLLTRLRHQLLPLTLTDRLLVQQTDRGLPAPDVTFFLDMGPDASAAARRGGGYGEELYEKEELQRKVRAAPLTLVSYHCSRQAGCSNSTLVTVKEDLCCRQICCSLHSSSTATS